MYLLSMYNIGSIYAEGRIKPIKHNTSTKKHNRLNDPKGIALFRASENLKYVMKSKKVLGRKITDSL